MKSLAANDYDWLEWQANVFAGLLLVPRRHLAKEAMSLRGQIAGAGSIPTGWRSRLLTGASIPGKAICGVIGRCRQSTEERSALGTAVASQAVDLTLQDCLKCSTEPARVLAPSFSLSGWTTNLLFDEPRGSSGSGTDGVTMFEPGFPLTPP